MPSRIRSIALYLNGTLAVLFLLITMILIGTLQLVGALFCGMVAALGIFNVYAIRRIMSLTTEEDYLKAEIRKAELRKELSAYDGSNEVVHLPATPPTATTG